MENFKDLLNLTPIEYKNIVKIDATWSYYNDEDPDDDSSVCQNSFNADDFFKDKKIDMVACLFGEIRARG